MPNISNTNVLSRVSLVLVVVMALIYLMPLRHVIDALYLHVSDNAMRLWSEWEMVINYRAGWARRALLGSIVDWTSSSSAGVNTFALVGIVGMVLWVVLLMAGLIRLIPSISMAIVVALASPFIAWYFVWDFEGFAVRKDYFVYSGLILHAFICTSAIRSNLKATLVIATVLVCVLIHEMTVFVLFAHWVIHHRGNIVAGIRLRLPDTTEWGLIAIGLIGVSSGLQPLSAESVAIMCDVVPQDLRARCLISGPMLSIALPSGYFFSDEVTNPLLSLSWWSIPLVLCLLNILLLYCVTSSYRRLETSLFSAYLVGLITLLPLTLLAIDWGRWLVLAFVTVFAILIASAERDFNYTPTPKRRGALLIFAVGLFVLALQVRVPHCCRIDGENLVSPIFERIDSHLLRFAH